MRKRFLVPSRHLFSDQNCHVSSYVNVIPYFVCARQGRFLARSLDFSSIFLVFIGPVIQNYCQLLSCRFIFLDYDLSLDFLQNGVYIMSFPLMV